MERAENDKSDDAIVTCEIFFTRGVRLIDSLRFFELTSLTRNFKQCLIYPSEMGAKYYSPQTIILFTPMA